MKRAALILVALAAILTAAAAPVRTATENYVINKIAAAATTVATAATNYTDSAVAAATSGCLSLSGGTMDADSTILWPSLHGDSDILIEGRYSGNRMFAIGTSGGNVCFYCYDRWLQLPYKQGTLAVEADISSAISTNNPEFVSAVLAVPLTGADASDLAEIGEYGSYGTVGAAILALIAGLAALKRGKADKAELPYDIVAVTPANGVVTVLPRTVATYTAGDSVAAFTVAVGAGETDKARDCEFVIDCTATGAVAPAVTWPASFHPHTDAATDFACEAGKRNVYFISEYAPGEFAVGGWLETAGGNA